MMGARPEVLVENRAIDMSAERHLNFATTSGGTLPVVIHRDHAGARVVIESSHEAHLATITETVESSWTTLTDAPEIGADLIATYLDTDEYRQPVTRQSMFPSGVYAVRAA